MLVNICLTNLNKLWIPTISFIKLCVFILLNKMKQLNTKTKHLIELLEHFLIAIFLTIFGGMLKVCVTCSLINKISSSILNLIHHFVLFLCCPLYSLPPHVVGHTCFVDAKTMLLLSSNNIFHQSTYPHTSQQNGIDETKTIHPIDTTHTLLLGANMHVHYWSDGPNQIFVYSGASLSISSC